MAAGLDSEDFAFEFEPDMVSEQLPLEEEQAYRDFPNTEPTAGPSVQRRLANANLSLPHRLSASRQRHRPH